MSVRYSWAMTVHMDKQQFLEALNDTWCRLGITDHGVGVVAIRPIPKGPIHSSTAIRLAL
jgi:hypothetical protein